MIKNIAFGPNFRYENKYEEKANILLNFFTFCKSQKEIVCNFLSVYLTGPTSFNVQYLVPSGLFPG